MEVNTSSTIDNENMYDYINGFFMNPSAFIIVLVVIIIYIKKGAFLPPFSPKRTTSSGINIYNVL